MRTRLLSLVVLSVLAAESAFAQEVVKKGDNLVEVTVTGNGTDKDSATLDAKRKAVEQGAGTYISSQSQTKDFVLVKDTVLAKAAGFIQSWEYVGTSKESEDGVWTVKIKAVVSVKGIEDAWGAVTSILKDVGRPKIMVFLTEKIRDREKGVDELVEDSTVQTRIQDMLLKDGFLLVDKNQIKEIDKKDLQAAVAEDNAAKVQAIAKKFGAQIFITGSSNAMPGVVKIVSGVQLHTYEAEANIKVYKSDNAQLMASIPGAATRGVQQVWRSAAKQALDSQAQQIAPLVTFKILEHWQEALAGRGELLLYVDGISFAQYAKLKTALKAIKEIKDVSNASYHNSIAEISIQSETTGEKLAEKLAEGIKALEITDVTANVIKAKYKGE